MSHNIALLGFGVVGQGFIEILKLKEDSISENVGVTLKIIDISDVMKDSLYHPEGLDLSQV